MRRFEKWTKRRRGPNASRTDNEGSGQNGDGADEAKNAEWQSGAGESGARFYEKRDDGARAKRSNVAIAAAVTFTSIVRARRETATAESRISRRRAETALLYPRRFRGIRDEGSCGISTRGTR